MTAKQIYVQALQGDDPSRSLKSRIYEHLGDILDWGETIEWPNVGNFDKKQLITETLRYDPSQAETYYRLFNILKKR